MLTILATQRPLLPHSSKAPQVLLHEVLAAEVPPIEDDPVCVLPPADVVWFVDEFPPTLALPPVLPGVVELLLQPTISVPLTTKDNHITGFIFISLRSLVHGVRDAALLAGEI
jgi:hypothetical protein